jgi:hypothetical protein
MMMPSCGDTLSIVVFTGLGLVNRATDDATSVASLPYSTLQQKPGGQLYSN